MSHSPPSRKPTPRLKTREKPESPYENLDISTDSCNPIIVIDNEEVQKQRRHISTIGEAWTELNPCNMAPSYLKEVVLDAKKNLKELKHAMNILSVAEPDVVLAEGSKERYANSVLVVNPLRGEKMK